MKNQFVPYELVVKLKELGFDMKCLAYYDMQGVFYPMGTVIGPDTIHFGTFIPKYQYKEELEPLVAAPLWQQVFEWFMLNHNMNGYITNNDKHFFPHIRKIDSFLEKGSGTVLSKPYKTYEEARIACLEKLIKIVNENNI